MTDIYTLYFDGACGPKNPGGTAAYGFVLSHGAAALLRNHGVVGTGPTMSNNVAEYAGLCAGLTAFTQLTLPKPQAVTLQVRGDSRLVINQMNGIWAVKGGLYQPYCVRAKELCKAIRQMRVKVVFDWVPREMNTECDELSKAYVTVQ